MCQRSVPLQSGFVALPGWAEKKDVLRLWQVNHLSFQSQAADLHTRQLVLVLHRLHIQHALLAGLHHTYEYFIPSSSLNLPQTCAPLQLNFYFLYLFFCFKCCVHLLPLESIYCPMRTNKYTNSNISSSHCISNHPSFYLRPRIQFKTLALFALCMNINVKLKLFISLINCSQAEQISARKQFHPR